MKLFSRFPILVWFLIIATLTSLSVSYYTYKNVFHKQIEDIKASELGRIQLRMTQLQGTVNDFNRRQDYNAIHREVSRLSADSTMNLIAIVDEHGLVRYSSIIEYRDTPLDNLPEINKSIFDINEPRISGVVKLLDRPPMIVGAYPLDSITHIEKVDGVFQSYLYFRFDISHVINELRYRQQQEIIYATLIHFGLLLSGFMLLYLGMRSRIDLIMNGIMKFSTGDYSSRIGLNGIDEFSKIGCGFDSMADKIQVQNRNLTDLAEQLREQHLEIVLQEQDLRVTLNSIGDAVIATDSGGLITRMNPVAEVLTGWSITEAAGMPITSVFKIIDASTGKPIENPIEKVIKTGEIVYLSNNTTLIARDGNEYQISDSAAPIRNEENHILGMVLIFNNVTEQYRLRKAAAKSELLLRSIMDNSPAVIYVKNKEGIFTYINKRFLTVFHLVSDDVVGKTDHDVFQKNIAESMVENDRRVLLNKGILEIEENVQQNDGLHIYSSIRFPLLDESGEIYAVCGIFTDITDRKQQEQILQRSQKMDALGKLTGGIAHDYNNMLGIIIGYSDLLKPALQHEPKLNKYANEIQNAAQRGVNLTKKLLSYSRPQKSDNQELDINALLQEHQDMLEKVLTARINLNLQLDKNLWPVWINASEFMDAIVNMGINAMHAMENGGKLTIRTSNQELNAIDAGQLHLDEGDYVLLSIVDTGVGMNKETQDKMFDPFFSTKGDFGVGLGLSQVYGLVETNHGAIKVHSKPGHGTCINIYLPRYKNTQKTEDKEQKSVKPEDLEGHKTILVVDDEPALRSLTEEVLTQHGYRVFTAENGRHALDLLETEAVDILLSDIIMPDMDGFQLADMVSQKYPAIKIQLVSGYNNKSLSATRNNALTKFMLNKPYTPQELLLCIKRLS